MAKEKEYFYMRLKEDFFDSQNIKIIEGMPDGYLYSNILLKMYLASLRQRGRLMLNGIIPYNAEMLSSVTGHQVGTVERALRLFESLGIIEVLDNGAIYMMNIQNFIGKSSTEADRKRDYRAKIEAEKAKIAQKRDICPDICPTEIEIDTDTEIDTDINIKENIYIKKTLAHFDTDVEQKCADKCANDVQMRTYDAHKCADNDQKCADDAQTMRTDVEHTFEELWKLYPKKLGKGRVSKAQKKKIAKVGVEEFTRCIDRYKASIKGKDEKYIMHGSTFFNSGYVDFLDANYEEPEDKPDALEAWLRE